MLEIIAVAIVLNYVKSCKTIRICYYNVRSAWTMSPAHPCVKCFFSKRELLNHIWGQSCLKEPWFWRFQQSFRSGRNHWKTVVYKCTKPKQCWINLAGQNIVWKHDPTLPKFTVSKEQATVNGSCPSAKTTALKSGMTLTTWVVQYLLMFLKFPTIFWDLFQSSTWPRA